MIMMLEIVGAIGTIAVTMLITGVQKHLSTRGVWQLGAIVPACSLVAMGVLYFMIQAPLSARFIVPCGVIIAIELFIWFDGRRQCRKEELLRMRIRDIH